MSRRSSTGCQWVKKHLGPLSLSHGRVSLFEYGMPMGKETLGSSIPVSWS